MKHILLILFILSSEKIYAQIFGRVVDEASGEALVGANLKWKNKSTSVFTNAYGLFSIENIKNDTLIVSFIGYKEQKLFAINESQKLNIQLQTQTLTLNEVEIKNTQIFSDVHPGKIKLSNAQIKGLPLLLGEKDLIKAFQLMPGIQEISEGSSSLSVRGGGKDQNLILLDESTVYNPNHLFGFFSTFNADPIQQAEIYKGAFPAQYGGRLSSVIDVKMKEGNTENFEVEGGIGLISSRLMVQGPLQKSKSSFLLSGRRTYADWLMKPFMNSREQTSYNFGDLNAKMNFYLNPNNRLFLSFYTGSDLLLQENNIPRGNSFLKDMTQLSWKNATGTLRLNTVLSKKLFQNASLVYSNYNMMYKENTEQPYKTPPVKLGMNLNSHLQDYSLKLDYDYFAAPNLQVKWGAMHTFRKFDPRDFEYYNTSNSEDNFKNSSPEANTNDGAVYVNFIGKRNSFFYENGLRLSYFPSLNLIKPEPRIMFGYKLPHEITVTGSYSKMNQYLHLVSNTGNGLPTDIWIPATASLKPGSSDILGMSASKNFKDEWKITAEAYYKWIKGSNEYKNGVNFLGVGQSNNLQAFNWDDVLTQGKSWNYGYEFSIEKSKGRFTAFGGYTLAWSISKFDEINNGRAFYNRQDRRHILEFSGRYALTKKLTFSSNFNFSTGNALTVPDGLYFTNDIYTSERDVYNSYNGFRAENYHRLDLGLNLKTKRGSWDFSVYNVYNRKNPYSYQVKNQIQQNGKVMNSTLNRQWLLPIIPSVSYNFKF